MFLKIALSAAEFMSFGHLGAAIWHRCTINCEGAVKDKCYPDKPETIGALKDAFVKSFCSKGIIGPFFFGNEEEEAVTVNGNRYRAILNELLFTKIEEEDIGNIWLQ